MRTAMRLGRQPASPEVRDTLQKVAERVPQSGMTSSQFQALLEDDFPTHAHLLTGLGSSVYDALAMHPDLFALTPVSNGRWSVRPAGSKRTADHLAILERHCARLSRQAKHSGDGPLIALEEALAGCGVAEAAVVDEVVAGESAALEPRVELAIRPRRPPRAAYIFVDGDELPAAAVDEMCNQLSLIKEECTVCIVRRSSSRPLSAVDVVSPGVVPTFLSVEKKARELRLRSRIVLRDVVYMCSTRQFTTYARHVAKLNSFPDADVYVCSPSRIEVVQKKTVLPYAP